MANSVRLVDVHGPTRIWIDAEISDKGDLEISGQDIGDAPKNFWGDSDYEYTLIVPAGQKDRVLLALLEKVYGGNAMVVSEFREFLESKGIPCRFWSYA